MHCYLYSIYAYSMTSMQIILFTDVTLHDIHIIITVRILMSLQSLLTADFDIVRRPTMVISTFGTTVNLSTTI